MRRSVVTLVLLSVAACSPEKQNSDEAFKPQHEAATESVSDSDSASRSAGPAITVSAAPGVAFNYRHAFRLPAQQIAGVQEQHASACEKLGINRCRITGMRYRLVNQHDIEGMLAFKLDPIIARQFGKTAIEAVTRADGMLVDSEITGVDAGSAIKGADRDLAQLNEDLRKIEAQLARPGLPVAERTRLEAEAQQLRQSIRATRHTREEHDESLATTPMTFTYGSGDLVPGFDTRSPLRQALRSAGENFIAGATFLLILIVTLLPWLLVASLGWLAFRRFRPSPTSQVQLSTADDQQA